MAYTNISQQQSDNSQQPSHEIQEEEDKTEPVLTPSSKKPGSRGKHEELLLAECFIQISEDPKIGSDKKNDTFWYKILDAYNDQAGKRGFLIRTKNMLTRKWTPMNPEVGKFNSLVNETNAMSEENDNNLMTRIEILYRAYEKSDSKHKSAWSFLKDKHKWNNPESTNARRNRNRVTNEEPKLFGDDALPRPPGLKRIAKSQRSSNFTASSGPNPTMFQEMMQQQIEVERKEKIECMDREVNSRVALNNSKRVAEDLKVLQICSQRASQHNKYAWRLFCSNKFLWRIGLEFAWSLRNDPTVKTRRLAMSPVIMYICGRKKAEAEPAPPARDPRDVETIERLQQRIQELELQQLQSDLPTEEAETDPNI
ncbi:hypothetical protein Tco_0978081 [Tanacetum coccineum]|uniref:No apical meristem-associated C-terminal domain-containing protein n=1 Tax=Tanacetum coccineum TaxID=301880 RepID=A0ABQ5EM23_9ASTR